MNDERGACSSRLAFGTVVQHSYTQTQTNTRLDQVVVLAVHQRGPRPAPDVQIQALRLRLALHAPDGGGQFDCVRTCVGGRGVGPRCLCVFNPRQQHLVASFYSSSSIPERPSRGGGGAPRRQQDDEQRQRQQALHCGWISLTPLDNRSTSQSISRSNTSRALAPPVAALLLLVRRPLREASRRRRCSDRSRPTRRLADNWPVRRGGWMGLD